MVTRDDAPSKRPIKPTDAGDAVVAFRNAIEAISALGITEELFPHGLTKLAVNINLPGGISASLQLEGPTSGKWLGIDRATDSSDMESLRPPPPPSPGPGDPKPAPMAPERPSALEITKSIAGAAAAYTGTCVGNDVYDNNCAHFLSDAFIRAGYTELNPPCDCVNARCSTSAKRPIRARDMWCWFKKMATDQRNQVPKNEGYWAVFQLDESQYWGGHVVIIDTNTNTFFGTGNYPNWTQYCYKW